jgi:hypothetical protein
MAAVNMHVNGAASSAKAVDISQVHVVRAGETIHENVEGHAARTDSPAFKAARETLHKILEQVKQETSKAFYYGDGPIQAHHGGSIWIHDGTTWRMFQNLAGIEWCAQFCADPAKVDLLRRNAKALVDAFPQTLPKLAELGYADAPAVLDTPITDAAGVARFVDSLFNACVPLPQPVHTGTIKADAPKAAGKHTYPTPNDDTVFFCRDDFKPFVYDASTNTVYHVAPVATSGPNANNVRVLAVHAPSVAHPVAKQLESAERAGKALVLDENDPISKGAFR